MNPFVLQDHKALQTTGSFKIALTSRVQHLEMRPDVEKAENGRSIGVLESARPLCRSGHLVCPHSVDLTAAFYRKSAYIVVHRLLRMRISGFFAMALYRWPSAALAASGEVPIQDCI